MIVPPYDVECSRCGAKVRNRCRVLRRMEFAKIGKHRVVTYAACNVRKPHETRWNRSLNGRR